MSDELIRAAFRAGFECSSEGYNSEYPFEGENVEADARWCEMRDRAIAALPAVSAPVAVRVKPLVWAARDDLKGLHEACGADGLYRNVWDQQNGTWVYEGDPTVNSQQQSRFATLEAAKAAAQADYAARIMAAIDAPVAELVEAWAVFDPNWGEPTPLLTTIRDTEEEAIGAAIATQERGASMYSGYSIHCVPQLLGDWQKMESHGYKTGRVSLRAALARIGGQ